MTTDHTPNPQPDSADRSSPATPPTPLQEAQDILKRVIARMKPPIL